MSGSSPSPAPAAALSGSPWFGPQEAAGAAELDASGYRLVRAREESAAAAVGAAAEAEVWKVGTARRTRGQGRGWKKRKGAVD